VISALTRGLETRKPSLLGHISTKKGFGNQKNSHKTKEVST